MGRNKRRKRRLVLVALLLAAVLCALTVQLRLMPLAREMAVTQVVNNASNLINDAIDAQIRSNAVDYDSMVYLEKNADGSVSALKTNIGEVNRLKTQILDQVNAALLDLDMEQVGVPIGNLLFPAFFSGRGFLLPVKVLSIQSSEATFENRFSQAGINQTLHQILMNIAIQMLVVTPGGTEVAEVSSQVVVAETVIVGTVPDSYLTLDKTAIAETKE